MVDRIVQINDLSDPKGGASKLAVLAACELRRRGHSVTFITGDRGNGADLLDAGVDVVALGDDRLLASGALKAMTNGLWNRRAHAMVRDWIARHDSPGTTYQLHGWSQILSPAVFSALAPVRDRLLIAAHDFFLACPNGAYALLKTGEVCPHRPLGLNCLTTGCDRDGPVRKAWRCVRQGIVRAAYRPTTSPPVLAIHGSMREFLGRAGIPAENVVTLPNPVEPYTSYRIEAEANRELLFVGRLEETKGADLAAAAAAACGAALTVVGEGPLADRIRAIHPGANLVGRRTPAEIVAFARKARALVMPSRYPEPFGLVAMEAAWSGLPVILAETALISGDLVDADAGIAIDPRDTPAFASAIDTLMQNDNLARQMSEAAFGNTRSLALTVGDWIDRTEAYHRSLVSNSPAPEQRANLALV